ncbi:MAG: IclR family transcriptional regulator [Rubrivivax sp.]|nr:IclR family transcriptional regulator [Rubrivivax sp.]
MTAAAQPDYTNEAQQRLMRLVLLLAVHEVHGLAPAAIARDLGANPSVVTRDMANLAAAGWAERVPATGHWRLGPTPVQLGLRHMVALDQASARLTEIRDRYSRTS